MVYTDKYNKMIYERAWYSGPVSDNPNLYGDVVVIDIDGKRHKHKMIVDVLCAQTKKPAIVLVSHKETDIEFILDNFKEYDNVHVCIHGADPYGSKLQHGIRYARRIGAQNVIISDVNTLLSLEYIELVSDKLNSGMYDRVCSPAWYVYMYHHPNKQMFRCDYTGSRAAGSVYDHGQAFSSRFLNKIEWKLWRDARMKGAYEHIDSKCRSMEIKQYNIQPQDECYVMSMISDWDSLKVWESKIAEERWFECDEMKNHTRMIHNGWYFHDRVEIFDMINNI